MFRVGWLSRFGVARCSYFLELEFVRTRTPERPNPETATPLTEGNTAHQGRGSIVWFTQASMLQSTELPFCTVKETKEAEAEMQRQRPSEVPYFTTKYDVAAALADGYFPPNAQLSNTTL